MSSEPTLSPSESAVDDCVGFAHPADILTRLTPDDLHPTRLAGPHAWHAWGLTAAPPTDRHLRLILPAGASPNTADQLLDRLERKLSRAPWPPGNPLDVRRGDRQLDCRDAAAQRSLIEVDVARQPAPHRSAEVVTRDGWPILGELAALNDRIESIDVESPRRSDLADFAAWVQDKMTARPSPVLTPLDDLLRQQRSGAPATTERLQTILDHRSSTDPHTCQVLDYLSEQLQRCRKQSQGHQRV